MTFIRSVAAVAATALLATLCATGARAADGTLTPVRAFTSAGATLTVYTYTEGTSTLALLGVANSAGVKFSFAIDKGNVAQVLAGWKKASALTSAQPAAAATVAEDGTSAMDVLLLAGGPAVRFSIADPVNGIAAFTLAPARYAALGAALTAATSKINI